MTGQIVASSNEVTLNSGLGSGMIVICPGSTRGLAPAGPDAALLVVLACCAIVVVCYYSLCMVKY